MQVIPLLQDLDLHIPTHILSHQSGIFQTDDLRYELEYEDPDLEEGELPASVAKEILDGLAQRVGKTFEEFMMDESIPDIPEKDMGSHSDDVQTPENNEA